jgi:hypothetical protein
MRLNSHVKSNIVSINLIAISLLIISSLAFAKAIDKPIGEHEGEDVKQPIEFPHNVHVIDNDINCLYCHTYARRSKVAGIPPLSKCIGCHKIVAKDKPRIKKLTQYWNEGVSPVWKKVHDLPDFVHFTHERHLKKLLFDRDTPVTKVKYVCAICHGEVGEMTVAKKNKPLNMGWCVECHEKNSGPGDCWKCHK